MRIATAAITTLAVVAHGILTTAIPVTNGERAAGHRQAASVVARTEAIGVARRHVR